MTTENSAWQECTWGTDTVTCFFFTPTVRVVGARAYLGVMKITQSASSVLYYFKTLSNPTLYSVKYSKEVAVAVLGHKIKQID